MEWRRRASSSCPTSSRGCLLVGGRGDAQEAAYFQSIFLESDSLHSIGHLIRPSHLHVRRWERFWVSYLAGGGSQIVTA